MPDVVVTVPARFTHPAAPGKKGLAAWIAEGDAADDPPSGSLWDFWLGRGCPSINRGQRVYVVCEGRVRGYAPLVAVELRRDPQTGRHRYVLLRAGGARAVTIPDRVQGFQGFRYRWWALHREIPFPDWRTP